MLLPHRDGADSLQAAAFTIWKHLITPAAAIDLHLKHGDCTTLTTSSWADFVAQDRDQLCPQPSSQARQAYVLHSSFILRAYTSRGRVKHLPT